MPKFRKKPVVIEAIKYRTIKSEIMEFCPDVAWRVEGTDEIPYIKTLEGNMRVNSGDYIIKGVKGEFYPCKSDIFEMTYEAVSDEKRILWYHTK